MAVQISDTFRGTLTKISYKNVLEHVDFDSASVLLLKFHVMTVPPVSCASATPEAHIFTQCCRHVKRKENHVTNLTDQKSKKSMPETNQTLRPVRVNRHHVDADSSTQHWVNPQMCNRKNGPWLFNSCECPQPIHRDTAQCTRFLAPSKAQALSERSVVRPQRCGLALIWVRISS